MKKLFKILTPVLIILSCIKKDFNQNRTFINYLRGTTWATDKLAFETDDYKLELKNIDTSNGKWYNRYGYRVSFDSCSFHCYETDFCGMRCFKNIFGYYTYCDTNSILIFLNEIRYDGFCKEKNEKNIDMRNNLIGKYIITKDYNTIFFELKRE